MSFDDWMDSGGGSYDDLGNDVPDLLEFGGAYVTTGRSMTARDIADAVLKQPPEDPVRFAKLARLVETQAKLDAVVALLPEGMRADIVAGMRGRVK